MSHPKFTSQLLRLFNFSMQAPSIVTLKSTDFFKPLNQFLSPFSLQAKTFSPLPFAQIILPRPVARQLADLSFVNHIALDTQVFVPEVDPQCALPSLKGLISSKKFKPAPFKNVWPTGDTREYLGIDSAEDNGFTGKGMKVVVIDSDYRIRTSQLENVKAKNLTKWDMVDTCGHGTHVASTIVGKSLVTKDGYLIKGMAPDADLVMLKALSGPLGIGSISTVLAALQEATRHRPDVINLSLGSFPQEHDPLKLAVEKMAGLAMIVTAAGNTGPTTETIMSPAISEAAITVGSINQKQKVSAFSARGPTPTGHTKPDVVAPGEGILSSVPKLTYTDWSDFRANGLAALNGTSMAAAHISGMLLLLKQAGHISNAEEFKMKLANLTQQKSNATGYGLATWGQLVGASQ